METGTEKNLNRYPKLVKEREVWFIFGRTGFGKSVFTRKLLVGEIESKLPLDRVIVLDHNYEYGGVECFSFPDVAREVNNRNGFRLVTRFLDIPTLDPETGINLRQTHYEYIFKLAWECGRLCIVIEEAYRFLEHAGNALIELIQNGRHMDISLVFVSPRIVDMTTDLRAQAHKIISFRQNLPNDLARLESMGFDTEKVSKLEIGDYEVVTP
jgi:Helicase HerA, central domain